MMSNDWRKMGFDMEMDDYMEDMEFKNKQKITTTISTHNNVDYLKLAVKSVRQNAYYKLYFH